MEPTSRPVRCSVMYRWKSACRPIIRCARFDASPTARLERLSPRFGTLYVNFGRPSIAPEKLLRALLLQALYTIRSERQLMEQLDFNLLFRWFVGLGIDDAGVVAHHLYEESGPPAGWRHRRGVFRGRADPRRHRPAAVARALHGRRHAVGGVGESQEFQTARHAARSAGGRECRV